MTAVGEFERSDATIQIKGLQPGNCYGIRAVATNQAGNSSYSGTIQVQTIPQDGHRATKLLSNADHGHAKRNSQSRRVSQPLPTSEHVTGAISEIRDGKDMSDETTTRLTKRLDSLKRQKEEAEIQAAEEIKDAEATKVDLIKRRDELRKSVEDSEKASQEFRKQVWELEKQCKSAQRKKSAKERCLQQKKAERQKMKDEIARWDTETRDAYQTAQRLREQKSELEVEHKQQMEKVEVSIGEVQSECTRMEEELRELGIKVKELDEQRAKANQEKYEAEAEAERRKEEEEQAAENRIQELQIQYSTWWKMITDLEVQRDMEAEKVDQLLRIKDQNPHMFAPVPGLDYVIPPMFPTPRRLRQNAPRGGGLSFHGYSSGSAHHVPFESTSSASPSFSAVFPHFGLGNSVSPDNGEHPQMSQQDIDTLTAGAPMSPSANTLLPSNLLGDDDDPRPAFSQRSSLRKDGNNSRPQSFRPPSTDPKAQDPQSPLSINSKSPSLLSSPHESLSNIQSIYGRDQHLEDDNLSIPPSSSPFAGADTPSNAGSSRKISGLFNWPRRGKSGLAEPPLLGTLKQGQSQSFPLNMDQEGELNSSGRRKSTNMWNNTVSGLWNKNAGTQSGDSNLSSQVPRKSRRGPFGARLEPSEPIGESSRPSSTYSFGDGLMQQPSDFQQFNWGTPESSRTRTGADWAVGSASGPWSHSQSRRPSLQHGSTSNLSLGSTPIDPNEEYVSPYMIKKTNQPAPIGTERFKISQRPKTPRLNPAAPSFTGRLFNRDSKRTPRSEKSHEFGLDNAKSKDSDKSRELDTFSKSSSPSVSRKSQDAYSMMTSDSVDESHEPVEPSESATPSETALTPSMSTPKETLMQRLTRKSSSTKFWGKDRSSKASSKGAPSTPGEMDEDGSDYLGRSVESSTSTPQDKAGRGSLSWSRVMGKAKKKGDAPPSETSTSRTSDGEDDEFDDE